jgi:DNA polymerase
MHIHDEIIVEDDGSLSLDELSRIMGQTPPWASGLLLRADGDEMDYYRKA